MKKETSELLSSIAAAILILLFIYTGFDKIFDSRDFHSAMERQPLPKWMIAFLLKVLPYVEISTAMLLIPSKTRLIGFYISMILMTGFSIYIALGIIHVFKDVPCSCAGVFRYMTWPHHLLFNIGIMIDVVFGIVLIKKYLHRPSQHLVQPTTSDRTI